ncbi:hypothetical protein NBRC116495_23830 [Aurantivibrio plasticivorans]
MADHIYSVTVSSMSKVIPFKKRGVLPIMFACSGPSDLAQVSNDIAITLHNLGYVEMLSLSSIGANIESVIDKAKTDRPVYVIEGCDTSCAKRCLESHGIQIEKYINLNALNVTRHTHHNVSFAEGARYLRLVYQELGITRRPRLEIK